MSMNCIFYMVTITNFMLYVFYNKKRIGKNTYTDQDYNYVQVNMDQKGTQSNPNICSIKMGLN